MVSRGFKQTEVGEIPEDWAVGSLGTLARLTMGRTPARNTPAYWGAGHPWLSIADLHGRYVGTSKEQITGLAAALMEPVPSGTLVMSFKLSIGRVAITTHELYTNEAICHIRDPLPDRDYLFYALQRTDFELYGKQAVKGYTLNSESLRSIQVPVPPLPEQKRIAKILSDTDALINSLNALIAKKQMVKQATMDDLLTGRRRLAGFDTGAGFQQTDIGDIPVDWRVSEVSELGQIIRRQMDPRTHPQEWFQLHGIPEFDNGKSPLTLRGSEIGSSKVRFEPGDVLFSKLNPRIPRVWVPRAGSVNNICSPEFLVLRPSPSLHSQYVSAWFTGGIFFRLVLDAVSGTTGSHQRLDSHSFGRLPVALPPHVEQQAIAKVLSDMDEDIEVLIQRRDKTIKVKQALMDELLTGRTRV